MSLKWDLHIEKRSILLVLIKINPWLIKVPEVHSISTIFHLFMTFFLRWHIMAFVKSLMAHSILSFWSALHEVLWAIYTNWMCIKQACLGWIWIETHEHLNCGSESRLSHSLVYCGPTGLTGVLSCRPWLGSCWVTNGITETVRKMQPTHKQTISQSHDCHHTKRESWKKTSDLEISWLYG